MNKSWASLGLLLIALAILLLMGIPSLSYQPVSGNTASTQKAQHNTAGAAAVPSELNASEIDPLSLQGFPFN